MTASWTPPADNGDAITGYRVQYRQHPGGAWAVSGGVLNADARSLEIAGLENGATYRVRAQAQNGAGWGQYSWPLAEITLPAPQPPASVGSVSASRSNGAIAVSWDAAAGATKYHVTYTDNGGQSWSLAALEHSATSITISGADDDKAYVVGVRAGNDAGWSGWTNSNEVPAVQTPPGSVGSVSATHNGGAVSGQLGRGQRSHQVPRDLHRRRRRQLVAGRPGAFHHQHHHQRRRLRQDLRRRRAGRQRRRLERLGQLPTGQIRRRVINTVAPRFHTATPSPPTTALPLNNRQLWRQQLSESGRSYIVIQRPHSWSQRLLDSGFRRNDGYGAIAPLQTLLRWRIYPQSI